MSSLVPKLIYGIGLNSGKYPAKVNGKNTHIYNLWRNVLARCYDPNYHREKPTYVGCSVSGNFQNYSYFYEWAQQQIGFGQENYHLDKDLILRGNRVYSEDTCVFLPWELNGLLLSRKSARGTLPIGVSDHRGRFRACCSGSSRLYHIGIFDTVEEAFLAYKQAKESYIKLQAEKWKALIDPRAFAALMAYEVSITD